MPIIICVLNTFLKVTNVTESRMEGGICIVPGSRCVTAKVQMSVCGMLFLRLSIIPASSFPDHSCWHLLFIVLYLTNIFDSLTH